MNVYQATMLRIEYILKEFEQIIISFSGGKDSGVMLNLVLDYAKENNLLDKVSVYHLDYEAQYQMTTDYVTRTFEKLPCEVKKYWFCLPIKAQCCTSMFQSYWQPWKLEDEKIWCRKLPEEAISEKNFSFRFDYEVADYDFNIKFAKAISKKKKTAFLIGIRTQESLHRYTAVNKKTSKNEYKENKWTTKITDNCYNVYPIFDWLVDDVWIANSRFDYDYNRLYDLMFQAGVPVNSMRVASPFNDAAAESLKLYKIIDPNNWAKLIGRVNGVNFTGLYGGTTAMGWQKIKKPNHFTWKDYMYFLLDTLPSKIRDNYLNKLETSIKYWTDTGGALPADVAKELPKNLDFEDLGKPKNNINYSRDYRVIKFSEYLDDIDMKNPNLFPTYKRMCIAILKNDTSCKTLGFGQTKDELKRRKQAIEKYKNIL